MFRLKQRPQGLFVIVAIALVAVSFFVFDEPVEFFSHDSYLLIPTGFLLCAIGVLLLFLWLMHQLTWRFLWNPILTWIHVLTTIIVVLLIISYGFWKDYVIPPIQREAFTYQDLVHDDARERTVLFPILVALIGGQFSFILNVILGALKRIA